MHSELLSFKSVIWSCAPCGQKVTRLDILVAVLGELLFTSHNLQFLGSSMYPTIPKNWQSEVGREDEKLVPSMTVYKSIQVLVFRYACEPHFIALLNIFLYLNLYPSDN